MRTSISIYNCRATSEGGQYDADDKIRMDTLQLAKELGSDYIEFELKVMITYTWYYYQFWSS